MAFRLNGAPVQSGGPEDRLLPWERVQDMAGISRTTAWRLQRSGAFPTPVPVSPGRVAWWESELTAWKSERGLARPLAPPARPRLPGMSRRAPVHTASPGPARQEAPPLHPELPIAPAAIASPAKRRRRSSSTDANQFDFGF